jgi:lactate permease
MSILLALTPIAVAVVALGGLSWSGRKAGVATLAVAVTLALFAPAFRLSPGRLVLALGEGAGPVLTVLFVLFPGLLLYHLQQQAGGMSALTRAVARLCPDRDLQVLLLVLGLAPCVESVSGFGMGTVVVVPVLAALGMKPFRAAVLGLLSQVAIAWGALAVGTALGAELTGVDATLIGTRTALLTAPLPTLYGLFALMVGGGARALRRWGALLAAGATLSTALWAFSRQLGIELAGLLGSLATLSLLIVWGRVARPAGPGPSEPAPPGQPAATGPARAEVRLWRALAPYAVLIVLLLLSRLVTPLRHWLQTHAVVELAALHLRLPVLYTPGFWVLVSALTAAACLGGGGRDVRAACTRAGRQFAPAAVAIVSFLGTAQAMRASGMTAELGLAAAALGGSYCWASSWLGALGGWLTGSNTGSNALFAQFQHEVGGKTGLPSDWLVVGQNSAASHGAIVSPARTVLAATGAGLNGEEGRLLRALGPVVLAAQLIITVLLACAV